MSEQEQDEDKMIDDLARMVARQFDSMYLEPDALRYNRAKHIIIKNLIEMGRMEERRRQRIDGIK